MTTSKTNISPSENKQYEDLLLAIERLITESGNSRREVVVISCLLRLRASIISAITLLESKLIDDAYSSMRCALETLVWIFGAYKLGNDDFENRRQLNFKVNDLNIQKDVRNFRLYKDETELASITERIATREKEIEELSPHSEKGYRIKIEENATIAEECGLHNLRKRYFKKLCRSSHPTVHSFMRYLSTEDCLSYIHHPYDDTDKDLISEMIYDFSLLIVSLLNQHHSWNIDLKTPEEYLETFEV